MNTLLPCPGEIDQPSASQAGEGEGILAGTLVEPGARPLRVGLLLDGLVVEAWQHAIIADLVAASWVEIPVAAICWAPLERQPRWTENLLAGRLHRSTELYDRYERVGAGRTGTSGHACRAPIASLIGEAEILQVVPDRRNRVFDRFGEADIERLRAHDLDVVLRFGFRILKGGVLSVARHGVWSFHHGDPSRYRGGPSCFWELTQGEKTVGVVLQRLSEDLDAGEVLYRSASSCPPTLWVNVVRDRHFRKSSRFVMRCLERLHRTGSAHGAGPPPDTEPEKEKERGALYKRPGNLAALGLLAKLAARTAASNALNLVRDSRWSVLIRKAGPDLSLPDGAGTVIGAIGNGSWQAADPCLHARDGADWCFFERMPLSGGKGEIAVVRVIDETRLSAPQTVIEEEAHLSYPFLFDWQGRSFLAAESAETGGVSVWEAERYPLTWRRRDTWLPGLRAYDPTIVSHGGLWYLFVTIDEAGGGPNDELFVFVSDTPLGPWQPHALNPVVSDCRFARPAGRMFGHGGRLIRPVQDCAGSYGRAINLCAVDALTPDTFSQRVVGRIDPAAAGGAIGCHTVSRLGGLEALDIRRVMANPFAWRRGGSRQ